MLKRTDVGFRIHPEDFKHPGLVQFTAGIAVKMDCKVETAFYNDPAACLTEAKERAKDKLLHHLYGECSDNARVALNFIRKAFLVNSRDKASYDHDTKIVEDLLMPIINAERGE